MRRDSQTSVTTRRAHDPADYNPDSDRQPSPWNRLDTATQRFVAWAGAVAIIITVCAWASQTIRIVERVTKVEADAAEAKQLARDNLAVTCILTRKVDPTIEPAECNRQSQRPK